MEPSGQLDMQQLLAAAANMQSQLMNAQAELAETEVQGTSGGGLVRATVNGQGELVDLSIDPAAIDAADAQESAQAISDLVLAAYRDACRVADELQQETMAPFAAGLGGGGMPGLPDLGSIFGGGGGSSSSGGGGGGPSGGSPAVEPPATPDADDSGASGS